MQLKKASFPLPMRYERPELRFTLRDGARYAMALQARGVDATKLLIGDPTVDHPDSPLLKVARWEDWCNPNWWREQAYDLVVMYGRPMEAIQAVRTGSPTTRLGLQMDSGYGVQVSFVPSVRAMLRRYPFYRWVREYSWLRAVAYAVAHVLRMSGPTAIRRQKALFSLLDEVRYENPFALEETARWCRRHGAPELAQKLVLAPHPVLPSMQPDPSVTRVPGSMISVADWTVKAKDADLLVKTLARMLMECPDATATVIGNGSDFVKERVCGWGSLGGRALWRKWAGKGSGVWKRVRFGREGASQTHTRSNPHPSLPSLAERITAIAFVHPEEMHRYYQRAAVYVGTSRCESFGISVAEALSCGCRVVLAPGIGVPSYRWFAGESPMMPEGGWPRGTATEGLCPWETWQGGVMARRRSAKGLRVQAVF